jgi:hypothetical protein
MSVEKIAGILFAPLGATHFSAIVIRNAYPGIAPTAQKTVFPFYYRHFAPKGATFLQKFRCVHTGLPIAMMDALSTFIIPK